MHSERHDPKHQGIPTAPGIPPGAVPIPPSLRLKRTAAVGVFELSDSPFAIIDEAIDEEVIIPHSMVSTQASPGFFRPGVRANEASSGRIKPTDDRRFIVSVPRRQDAPSRNPRPLPQSFHAAMAFSSHYQDKPKRSDYNAKLLILLHEAQRMQQSLPVRYRHSNASNRINHYKALATTKTLDNQSYSECLAGLSRERLFVIKFTQHDRLALIERIIQEISSEFHDDCRVEDVQATIQWYIQVALPIAMNDDDFYNLVVEVANFRLRLFKAHMPAPDEAKESGHMHESVTRPRTSFTFTTTRRGNTCGAEPIHSYPARADITSHSAASIAPQL